MRSRSHSAVRARLSPVLSATGFIFLVTTLARAQDIRIAEFLALNSNGLRDNDGEPSSWIELWNPSPTAKFNLAGWKLAHGASEWTFPSVEIMPDGRIVLFASGKNRTTPTAPLHANFVLAPGGGTLTLSRPDDSIASQFADYPAQQTDTSFGADAAQPTALGFYSSPTPGDPNNYSGPGVARNVLFSVASKAFSTRLDLAITQATPDPAAVIRYTTDGSVPINTSPLYAGPIPVTQTQVVRARVFKSGLLPGETQSQGYLLLDSASAAFSSAIPIVVVTSFGANIPAEPKIPGFMWVFELGADLRARLSNPPTLATRVAIDKRGSSTRNDPKFSLNVEARRARDEKDTDIGLLGMPLHADWVLHAPYRYDLALIRNPFMYGLSNALGRYAARTKMAEVFVDSDGGALTSLPALPPHQQKKKRPPPAPPPSNYFGVYNVMERIRRAKTRVNITKLNTYENDEISRTGGYIVKIDRRDPGETGFTTPHSPSFCYYRPKEEELTSPQQQPQADYLRGFLTSFDNACYNAAFDDEVAGYRAYLDIPAAIDHHLLNVLAFNVDALRASTYLYKDRGAKLCYGPIWDFDRALGSSDGRDANPGVWRSQTGDKGTDFFNFQWWNRLFNDIDFYQQYIDRWGALRASGAFRQNDLYVLVDSLNNAIGPEAMDRDLRRWGRQKRAWRSPFTGYQYPASQNAEIQRMKDWLRQRATFIDSQFVGGVTISPAGGQAGAGTFVTMSGPPGAAIYYTIDGADPRPAGGGPPVGAQSYTGRLVVNQPVVLRARAYHPNWTAFTGLDNPPLVSKWGASSAAVFSAPGSSQD